MIFPFRSEETLSRLLQILDLDLDLDKLRRRNHPSVVILATGRGGSTGDLKIVGSARCRCQGVGREGMDSFFTKLVPFVDCSDEERVSELFCLA